MRVLWGPWWREPLAEQQLHRRESMWEGSCRQSPGPRNTNRIRGVHVVGERANGLEARCHPDRVGVYAAGMWGEGHASYPGRPVRLSISPGPVASGGAAKGGQESAEAIVAAWHCGEGPNMRSGTCTERSMREEDADTRAEQPERSLSVGGGTAEGRETERQTGTARDEHASEGARAPEPHVFPVNRRIRNRTSGGVGGWGREAPPYPLGGLGRREPPRSRLSGVDGSPCSR